MEPLITIEGYRALQNDQYSRDLLSNYYRNQGYEVVTPKTSTQEGKPKVAVKELKGLDPAEQ